MPLDVNNLSTTCYLHQQEIYPIKSVTIDKH